MTDVTKPQVADEGTIEILRVLCGSRAYGLHDDDSDYDYHGVFVVPTHKFFEVEGEKIKEKRWIEGEGEDDVAWEVGHFLRLAVHCNPTVLETFVAPDAMVQGLTREHTVIASQQRPIAVTFGRDLRELFPAVVSKKRVFEAYSGYAHNQRKKMFEPTGGVRAGEKADKFAVAYCRALWQGAYLLRHGTLRLAMPHSKLWKVLKRIKAGNYKKAEVIDVAESLEQALIDSYLHSELPDQPDLERINKFLLIVRESFW